MGKDSVAAEKAKVMRAFTQFDTDGSGTIDKDEFQALCYELGIALTNKEVEDTMRAIGTKGNKTLSFEEFSAFWLSEQRPTSNMARDERISALKAKLEAQSYLRAAKAKARKLKASGDRAAVTGQTGTVTLASTVAVGLFDQDDNTASLEVTYSTGDEDLCAKISAAANVIPELPAAATLLLRAKPDVDIEYLYNLRYELAEVIGEVRRKEKDLPGPIVKVINNDQGRFLSVSVAAVWPPAEEEEKEEMEMMVGEFFKVAEAVTINSLEARVAINQKPGQTTGGGPFCGKAEYRVEFTKDGIEEVRSVLEAMDMEKERELLGGTTLFRNAKFETEAAFGNHKEFVDAGLVLVAQKEFDGDVEKMKADMPPPLKAFTEADLLWEFARVALLEIMLEPLQKAEDKYADMKEVKLFSLYNNLAKSLQSFEKLHVMLGKKVVTVTGRNADIFTILPSREDILNAAKGRWHEVADETADGVPLPNAKAHFESSFNTSYLRDGEKVKFCRVQISKTFAMRTDGSESDNDDAPGCWDERGKIVLCRKGHACRFSTNNTGAYEYGWGCDGDGGEGCQAGNQEVSRWWCPDCAGSGGFDVCEPCKARLPAKPEAAADGAEAGAPPTGLQLAGVSFKDESDRLVAVKAVRLAAPAAGGEGIEALIDGNPETSWTLADFVANAPAELIFEFEEPVIPAVVAMDAGAEPKMAPYQMKVFCSEIEGPLKAESLFAKEF